MRRIALLAVLAITVAAGSGHTDGPKDLTKVIVPDDRATALQVLKDWTTARGFDCELRKDHLVFKRPGLVLNIYPIVNKEGLDRLRVMAFYQPKEEYKGSKELEQVAMKVNRAQNFLQVWVNDDGEFVAGSNLTFYDELTPRLFDAFMDTFAQAVKTFILPDEVVKLLK